MTRSRATAIALSPTARKREREQAERFILRNYADAEERALYAKVRAAHGFIQWDWLRGILARTYR